MHVVADFSLGSYVIPNSYFVHSTREVFAVLATPHVKGVVERRILGPQVVAV
jgi:hypothetical protein